MGWLVGYYCVCVTMGSRFAHPTPHKTTDTDQVTDRKSINFDEAGERLVMGSLAAFKGKDWRCVILLDATEGVLPSKSSVHTTKEVRAAYGGLTID